MNSASRYSKRVLAGLTSLISVLLIALVFVGAELTACFIEPKPVAGQDVAQLDPHLGWIPRPGTWHIATPEFTNDWSVNSLTMNDREVTDTDLAAPVRILALGNSHTFAIGASMMEAWPNAWRYGLIRTKASCGMLV